MDGLLPKALSPTHYLKALGVMPKKPKVAEPAPDAAATTAGDPQAQMTVLGIAGLGLLMLLMTGKRDGRA